MHLLRVYCVTHFYTFIRGLYAPTYFYIVLSLPHVVYPCLMLYTITCLYKVSMLMENQTQLFNV